MKFSESIYLRLPKRTIEPEEYTVLARVRYNSRHQIESTERVSSQQLAHAPKIMEDIGFVVVRNILSYSAAIEACGGNVHNKRTVSTLQRAWKHLRTDSAPETAAMSVIRNEPNAGLRFTQPGLHAIIPVDGRQEMLVTQRRSMAQIRLRQGDALMWEQGEAYFPSVELHNTSRHYLGAFVLHESATYSNVPVAPGPSSVSQ